MSNTYDEDYDAIERKERREAEIEFVNCAYSPEEARGTLEGFLSRNLILDTERAKIKEKVEITVSLEMKMPPMYLNSSPLQITNASILSSNPSATITKLAMNSMPQLLQSCRALADENIGEESVLNIFLNAETWAQEVWPDILKNHLHQIAEKKLKKTSSTKNKGKQSNQIKLGRRAMYSHHIININKRKMIMNLAAEYELGGYMKIGRPGIILIEGIEQNCVEFWDDIRHSKWQYITVRHEESQAVQSAQELNEKRCFANKFCELGKNDMSILAQHCRDAGLEYLFKSCLKIPDKSPNIVSNSDGTDEHVMEHRYGILVHVDHMNDRKRYCKWLRRSAAESNCTILIAETHRDNTKEQAEEQIPNLSTHGKPIIVVAIFGEAVLVKQVMKRWRTSRVDIDSKCKPCLERQMRVLYEGCLNTELKGHDSMNLQEYVNEQGRPAAMEKTDLGNLLESIGGYEWRVAFEDRLLR